MQKRGLTQVELSAMSGISQSAISKYFRGQAYPKSIELYKIAKVLNVTMEWLLTGEQERVASDGDEYWHQEAIYLRTKLDVAVATLEGALSSLKRKRNM